MSLDIRSDGQNMMEGDAASPLETSGRSPMSQKSLKWLIGAHIEETCEPIIEKVETAAREKGVSVNAIKGAIARRVCDKLQGLMDTSVAFVQQQVQLSVMEMLRPYL